MSNLLYIASDFPLEVIPAKVIPITVIPEKAISNPVQDPAGFHPENYIPQPSHIPIDPQDFAVLPLHPNEDILTKKPYLVYLETNLTGQNAARLLTYLQKQLTHTNEVELWHIWMGKAYPPPKIKRAVLSIDELTVSVLQKIDAVDVGMETSPIRCRIPCDDWALFDDELTQVTHYCYTIRAKK